MKRKKWMKRSSGGELTCRVWKMAAKFRGTSASGSMPAKKGEKKERKKGK